MNGDEASSVGKGQFSIVAVWGVNCLVVERLVEGSW